MNKPSIAELLTRSGFTNFTEDLVQRAMYSLYGNVGAGIDLRDWDAIMAAQNPLLASEQALVAMYQSPDYLQRNIASLVAGGAYGPAQIEWTYREMYSRLGLTYAPGWSTGTTYESLGSMPTGSLLVQAQGEAAARAPVVPAAGFSFAGSDSGLSLTLSAAASVSLSVSGSLGAFVAGTTLFADQTSVITGFLSTISTTNTTSSPSTQFLSLGTAGNDTIDTTAQGSRVDYISGGAGHDIILAGDGADLVTGGAGNDTITGGDGADTLYGGSGDDRFVYASVATLFTGSALADQIDGGTGTNELAINGGVAGITISQGMSWGSRIANVGKLVVASASAGAISIDLADDAWEAGLRTIDLSGDTSTDVVNTISVAAESDLNAFTLTGHGGADFIRGGRGNDVISGGGGDDTIIGSLGADTLLGGAGNDKFYFPYLELFNGMGLDDSIDGGSGTNAIVLDRPYMGFDMIFDTSSWAGRISNVSRIELAGPTDTRYTIRLHDNAYEAGIRVIDLSADTTAFISGFGPPDWHVVSVAAETGTSNGYTLIGHAGSDTLIGGAGPDTIDGGERGDRIIGGGGADRLLGGFDGSGDTFVVDTPADHPYSGPNMETIDGGSGYDTLYLTGDGVFILSPQVYVEVVQLATADGLDTSYNASIDGRNIDASFNFDLYGNSATNTLWGNDADNVINGNGGDDTLYGGLGNDTLSMGLLYVPGEGDDQPQLRDGFAETVRLEATVAANGHDTMNDFSIGEDCFDVSLFLPGGSFDATYPTSSTGDVDIAGKAVGLSGNIDDIDTPSEVASLFNGPGSVFKMSSGGKGVIFAGSDASVQDYSYDLGYLFFVEDADNDGWIVDSEISLVITLYSDITNLGSLSGANFLFT